jgi:hypothetical protein
VEDVDVGVGVEAAAKDLTVNHGHNQCPLQQARIGYSGSVHRLGRCQRVVDVVVGTEEEVIAVIVVVAWMSLAWILGIQLGHHPSAQVLGHQKPSHSSLHHWSQDWQRSRHHGHQGRTNRPEAEVALGDDVGAA